MAGGSDQTSDLSGWQYDPSRYAEVDPFGGEAQAVYPAQPDSAPLSNPEPSASDTNATAFSSWADSADFPFFDLGDERNVEVARGSDVGAASTAGEAGQTGRTLPKAVVRIGSTLTPARQETLPFVGYRDDEAVDYSSSGSASPLKDTSSPLGPSPDTAVDVPEDSPAALEQAKPELPLDQTDTTEKRRIAKRQLTAGLQLEIPSPPTLAPADRPISMLSPQSLRLRPTPEREVIPPPAVTLTTASTKNWDYEPPQSSKMFKPLLTFSDPVEGLVQQMGEFLFFPVKTEPTEGGEHKRRRSGASADRVSPVGPRMDLIEDDGLTDEERNKL